MVAIADGYDFLREIPFIFSETNHVNLIPVHRLQKNKILFICLVLIPFIRTQADNRNFKLMGKLVRYRDADPETRETAGPLYNKNAFKA